MALSIVLMTKGGINMCEKIVHIIKMDTKSDRIINYGNNAESDVKGITKGYIFTKELQGEQYYTRVGSKWVFIVTPVN